LTEGFKPPSGKNKRLSDAPSGDLSRLKDGCRSLPGVFNLRTEFSATRFGQQQGISRAGLVPPCRASHSNPNAETKTFKGDFVRRTSVFQAGTFLYPMMRILIPKVFCSSLIVCVFFFASFSCISWIRLALFCSLSPVSCSLFPLVLWYICRQIIWETGAKRCGF